MFMLPLCSEKVIIPKTKVSIFLLGTDAARTIIQWHDTAGEKTTFWSCSVCIAADNFVAARISFLVSRAIPAAWEAMAKQVMRFPFDV